jgi:hypothetical protein
MEESINTGVIYMITNTVNGKKYVGKCKSYRNHDDGRIPTKHGAEGRFKTHKSHSRCKPNDIPLLYKDMREFGVEMFNVEVLEVCLLENLKEREKIHTMAQESYKPDIGYNLFIGDNKPVDEQHKKAYENRKAETNKNRAFDGKLRRSEDVADLPPNIYRRKAGIFAQIKLTNPTGKSTLYNKAFFIKTESEEVRIKKAQDWLEIIKTQHTNNILQTSQQSV